MRCVLDNTLSARAMLRFYNSVHQRSKAGGERDQPAVADKGSGARARRPIKVKYFFFLKKKVKWGQCHRLHLHSQFRTLVSSD